MDRPPAATSAPIKLFGKPFLASLSAAELARATGCAIIVVPGGGHGAEFCCAVEGGWAPFSPHALSLRLRGERCEPAISPAERSVDFGRFGVGLRRVVTLTLRNTGATGGAWYAQPDSVPPAASGALPGNAGL